MSRSFFLVCVCVFFYSLNTEKTKQLCINELRHLWWDRIRNSFAQCKKIRKNSVQCFFFGHHFSTTYQLHHHHQAHSFCAHTHWLWLIKIHWLISYNYYSYWLIHNLKSIGRAEEFKTHSIMLPMPLITYTVHSKRTRSNVLNIVIYFGAIGNAFVDVYHSNLHLRLHFVSIYIWLCIWNSSTLHIWT